MSRAKLALGYFAAICLVAGSGIAFRSRSLRTAESPVPSIENASARGSKALFTWLQETGAAPKVLARRYTALPSDAKVLVALAPTERRIETDELETLVSWIERGGTYVYALPRRLRTQQMDRFLEVEWIPGPRAKPLVDTDKLDRSLFGLLNWQDGAADPTGADAVPWTPSPLLAGVRTLRVAADDGLESRRGSLLPLAGTADAPSILSYSYGQGEVIALAGTDLAENRRIGLADNLLVWANLAARGPLYFDEYHQRAGGSEIANLAGALGPAVAQAGLAALILAFAIGRRLGEVRSCRPAHQRSQSEYLAQMALLYSKAGVEGALCGELYRGLRRDLHERLGIGAGLDDLEVARRLEARTGASQLHFLELAGQARQAEREGASPEALRGLAEQFALFEQAVGLVVAGKSHERSGVESLIV